MSNINLLSNISGRDWGSDRETLLLIYKSLIRSKLDYGAIFYSSASQTNLKKLDVIQSSALRIACGARRTTPIISLEVETNTPPLFLHRKFLLVKFLSKLKELPKELQITKDLIYGASSILNTQNQGSTHKTPAIRKAKEIEYELLGKNLQTNPTNLVGPVPPWSNHNQFCFTQFAETTVDRMTESVAISTFRAISEERHAGLMQIYTDGSRTTVGNVTSVTAGMVVFKGDGKNGSNWRLPPEMAIMTAELYAIGKALEYCTQNRTIVQ